jgi:hypothetical protein
LIRRLTPKSSAQDAKANSSRRRPGANAASKPTVKRGSGKHGIPSNGPSVTAGRSSCRRSPAGPAAASAIWRRWNASRPA